MGHSSKLNQSVEEGTERPQQRQIRFLLPEPQNTSEQHEQEWGRVHQQDQQAVTSTN